MITVFREKYKNLDYDARGIISSFFPGEELVFADGVAADAGAAEGQALTKETATAAGEAHVNDAASETAAAGTVIDLDRVLDAAFDGNRAAASDTESASNPAAAPDASAGSPGEPSKNDLRKTLYLYLQKKTGRSLPWGVLTGVRPTKLTMAAIASGKTRDEAARIMRDDYFVSEKKAALAAEISERELGVIRSLFAATDASDASAPSSSAAQAGASPAQAVQSGSAASASSNFNASGSSAPSGSAASGYSLYVGIPFCPTTCLYCSFTSYPISRYRDRVDAYLDALFKELDWASRRFAGRPCHSVYVGGGTPTSLEAEQLDTLLARIRDSIEFAPVREFTVEAGRPDSIMEAKLQVMARRGVTRISINPQTMNDATLRLIGRSHRSADIIEKFGMARGAGFDNINMDVILGLPGERTDDVKRTMESLAKLCPDSLTVHALAVKRASRLKMEAAGAVMPGYSDEESAAMMEAAVAGARGMGLAPYYLYRQKNMAGSLENVGFSAPGKEGIYNIVIIEETESIAALGAGTVSKRVDPLPGILVPGVRTANIHRCDCAKDVDEYIARVDEMIRRKMDLFACPYTIS